MNRVITKVSEHKKGKGARLGLAMYTVAEGNGSKRKSYTKHMTEAEASRLRKE